MFAQLRRWIAMSAVLIQVCPETGFTQTQTGGTKSIPITVRDFSAGHPDFESPACYGGKNMVQPKLDAEHKPVHQSGNTCADNRLQEWFRDAPANKRYCREMVLTRKAGSEDLFEVNDNTFFPIDDVPTREPGFSGDDGQQHNFHFCMEMHATFKYRGGEVFNFKGDDDVWVFINNTLALHLGGVHTPQEGVMDKGGFKDSVWIRIHHLPAPSLPIAMGGYYQDRNGDGRIETAVFPPFLPGTGFFPSHFASIPDEPGASKAQTVILKDSCHQFLRRGMQQHQPLQLAQGFLRGLPELPGGSHRGPLVCLHG